MAFMDLLLRFVGTLSVALITAALPAHAVTLTIGGGVPAISSGIALGQVSPFAGQPGVVTEDFSTAAGCGVSKVVQTGLATIGAHSLFNRRLEPLQDASCYFAVGTGNPIASATLTIPVPIGKRIDYIGFYLGSYDPYNYISFTNASGFDLGIATYGDELNGSQIASTAGAPPLFSSVFVGFSFSVSEVVRAVALRQTNFAVEIDSLTYRLIDVFAPTALANPSSVRAAISEPGDVVWCVGCIALIGLVRRRRPSSLIAGAVR